ncbi:hypothetical protein LCGC14_2022510 [marine sediment metagenome]|uniref:Uncharacterized protein n=1 Tax=marine sediment metagenome TaxID=412755 RepID=A0A0F9FJJ5_9ZZZZ
MKKHVITSIVIFFTILSIFPAFIAAKPIRWGPPDEWMVADSYHLEDGSYYDGALSDTYSNNGAWLIFTCTYTAVPPEYSNTFEVEFDFSNSNYKKVKLEADTDQDGRDGSFYVEAVYTTGDPVRLGTFSPDDVTVYYNLNKNLVLDKIILGYLQNDVEGQRAVFIDEIRALWTYVP